MPTYDYVCPDGHSREAMHGMNEEPDVRCHEMVPVSDQEGTDPTDFLPPNRNGEAECMKPMKKQISGGFRPRVKGGTPVHHERGKKTSTRKGPSVRVSTEGIEDG